MGMRAREPGLVLGRNYVETLILTYEQFQLLSPGLDIQEYIVVRLEELLCSIAYTSPHIKNIYHRKIWNILQEQYPDLPRPDLKSCFAYNRVKKWLDDNKKYVVETDLSLATMDTIQEYILKTAIQIIRTAVISTLMETGVIKLS
ncbi:hypothetical protein DRN93_05280 [archaeon]|nr:MAG: hypothetical protein DRN93_05280 [archaeon]